MSFLTTDEAAAALDVSVQRVYQLIETGQLSADRVGRTWLIDAESVQARKAASRRAGRPPRVASGERPLRYTLMNRTHEVLSFTYDAATGLFSDTKEIFDAKRAPLGLLSPRGAHASGAALRSWWHHRAIPASRMGIDAVLARFGYADPSQIPFSSLGLSLSDQYWVRPDDRPDLNWEDVNFFHNEFGRLEAASDWLSEVGLNTPDNTSEGMLPKKWICDKGERVLLKGGGLLGQEPFNEIVATALHRRALETRDYVTYRLQDHGGEKVCACSCFIGDDEEYVPAYYVLKTLRQARHHSDYQHYRECCAHLGVAGDEQALAKMIVCDDVLANHDRHLRNFGLIRNVETLECRPAPLFDSGNSLWVNATLGQLRTGDFSFKAKPFYEDAARQLRLVVDYSWLDLSALDGFVEEAQSILSQGDLPEERVEHICAGLRYRIDRLERILL